MNKERWLLIDNYLSKMNKDGLVNWIIEHMSESQAICMIENLNLEEN